MGSNRVRSRSTPSRLAAGRSCGAGWGSGRMTSCLLVLANPRPQKRLDLPAGGAPGDARRAGPAVGPSRGPAGHRGGGVADQPGGGPLRRDHPGGGRSIRPGSPRPLDGSDARCRAGPGGRRRARLDERSRGPQPCHARGAGGRCARGRERGRRRRRDRPRQPGRDRPPRDGRPRTSSAPSWPIGPAAASKRSCRRISPPRRWPAATPGSMPGPSPRRARHAPGDGMLPGDQQPLDRRGPDQRAAASARPAARGA